jgi:hypothetical protein
VDGSCRTPDRTDRFDKADDSDVVGFFISRIRECLARLAGFSLAANSRQRQQRA